MNVETVVRVVVVIDRRPNAMLVLVRTTWPPGVRRTRAQRTLVRKADAVAYRPEPYEAPDAPSLPDQLEVDEHSHDLLQSLDHTIASWRAVP